MTIGALAAADQRLAAHASKLNERFAVRRAQAIQLEILVPGSNQALSRQS